MTVTVTALLLYIWWKFKSLLRYTNSCFFVSVTANMRYEGIQSNFAFKDFTPENLKKEAEALISVSLD